MKIKAEPRVAPLIITTLGQIPYSSDKVVPWNYGVDVHYHGIKEEPLTFEGVNTEVIDPNIDNISRTSKVTRSGRVFSPEISLKTIDTPICVTSTKPIPETRNKGQMNEPAQTEESKEVTAEDTYKQEMDEVLKII